MTVNLNQRILEALRGIIAHEGNSNIVPNVQIDATAQVIVTLEVNPSDGQKLEPLRQKVEREVAEISGVKKVVAILTAQKPAPDPHGMNKNPPIDVPARNIIAIASGKGGVGKSTVAANIAAVLAKKFKVGLLDADIYGPSQPLIMGEEGYRPKLNANKKFEPLEKYGLKIMSVGFLTEPGRALAWRGPMVQTAFYQMLRDVAWEQENQEPLDYLIIDLPPGTGDVQLTLAQKVRATGAIIVSTPQDISLIDARRAVEMFRKTKVPIVGIVENMSVHVCSNCGHAEHIFGNGGARNEAKLLDIPFLGEIPLSKEIREHTDNGIPIVIAQPNNVIVKAYDDIARYLINGNN